MVSGFLWSKAIETQQNMRTNFNALGIREKIKLICIMYISVWVTAPILAYGTAYRVLAFLAIIVWLILELSAKRSVLRKPTSYILMLYLFLLYTIPVSYLADGISALTRNIQFYIMVFFLFVYASYRRKSLEILKPVVYLNIILFTVWMMTTYMALLQDSHISRTLIRSSEVAVQASQSGVGGFSFIYALLIYIVAVMALLKNRFKEKKRLNITSIFLLFSVLLAMLVVLKAEYSTAVILMVLSVVYFLFHTKSVRRNIIIFLVFILAYLLLKSYMADFLQFLLQFAEGTNYRFKLEDMITSLNTDEAAGTAGERIDRYIRSINIFLENPFAGIWSIETVGKHSLILDTFAQFGIFAGVALIYILFKIPYQILKKQKKNRTLALTALFLIVALSSLNNVSMAYGFIFYLFYPYIITRLEHA